MLSIFNTNKPIILFFIPVFAALVWWPLFDFPISKDVSAMPLHQFLQSLMAHPLLRSFIAFAALISGALLLNRTVAKHHLLIKNTNLPVPIYVLLFGAIVPAASFNPVIFANIFLILALDSMLTMYNQNTVHGLCFQAGFFVGLATHFYLAAALFILLLFLSLVIIRTFHWRDWVIGFMGFLVPFLYSWTYFFWHDQLPEYYGLLFSGMALFTDTDSGPLGVQKVVGGLFLLLGAVEIYRQSAKATVRRKNLLTIVLLYSGISVISLAINKMDWVAAYILAAIPMTIMLSIYLQSLRKKWIAEASLLLWLAIVVTSLVRAIL